MGWHINGGYLRHFLGIGTWKLLHMLKTRTFLRMRCSKGPNMMIHQIGSGWTLLLGTHQNPHESPFAYRPAVSKSLVGG